MQNISTSKAFISFCALYMHNCSESLHECSKNEFAYYTVACNSTLGTAHKSRSEHGRYWQMEQFSWVGRTTGDEQPSKTVSSCSPFTWRSPDVLGIGTVAGGRNIVTDKSEFSTRRSQLITNYYVTTTCHYSFVPRLPFSFSLACSQLRL